MKRCLLITIVAVVWALPRSGWAQNPAAAYECDRKSSTLVIRTTDDLDEAAPPWPKKLRIVEFSSLLDLNQEQTMVEGTRSESIVCRLRGDRFEITFEPGVPNPNLLVRCGAAVTGIVTVKRNGTTILDEQEFEDMNCHERKPMLETIRIRAGSSKPRLTYAPYPD
ncbi:MAG TPA: hypothetical protein VLV78_14780 [Thermoanaerobaculia bacterium]|nr:hypothetical protein [Thermoanaerobaculia bacterium]